MTDYFDGKTPDNYYRTMKGKATREWRKMSEEIHNDMRKEHTKALHGAEAYFRWLELKKP